MEIVRDFAAGTVRDIERNYGVVLDPFETSLARLVDGKRPIRVLANRENPDFMNLLSRPTQIAFFLESKRFYVPESNNKSLEEQKQLIKVDETEVVRNWRKMGIGGAEEVIVDVATHAGLVFAYFDKTEGRGRLHGKDYGYRHGRTGTPTVGSNVVNVGYFYEGYGVDRDGCGLRVDDWSRDKGGNHIWVVRLLVPAQE